MKTFFKRIGGAIKDVVLGVAKANRTDVYIRVADIKHEREVHYKHLINPHFEDLCAIYNFLPDNEHEGKGRWERVELVKHKGLSVVELSKITDRENTDGKVWTYIPEEVLHDLQRAKYHEIGFVAPGDNKYSLHVRVVWIHLID